MGVPRLFEPVEGQLSSAKNWVIAADELSGVLEGDMSIEDANESTEPVVGRLGGDAQRGHLV